MKPTVPQCFPLPLNQEGDPKAAAADLVLLVQVTSPGSVIKLETHPKTGSNRIQYQNTSLAYQVLQQHQSQQNYEPVY